MFCQDKILVIAKPLFNHLSDDSTYGYHQMVSTKIRLIIFLQLKMEKLYTVSKNKTTTTTKNLGADCGSDHESLLQSSNLN